MGAPTKPGWGVGGPRRLPTAPFPGEPLVLRPDSWGCRHGAAQTWRQTTEMYPLSFWVQILLHAAFPPRHWASPPLRTPVTGFRAHPGPGGSRLEGFTSVNLQRPLLQVSSHSDVPGGRIWGATIPPTTDTTDPRASTRCVCKCAPPWALHSVPTALKAGLAGEGMGATRLAEQRGQSPGGRAGVREAQAQQVGPPRPSGDCQLC